MSTHLATPVHPDMAIIESLALRGDISGLSPLQKVEYYKLLCERCGLDPTAQPFLPLKLNGKEVLYAARSATDQLAKVHNVTRTITSRERIEDVWVVTAKASIPSGRIEESVGAVAIGGLKGDQLANALMRAETKSKRRATLSICGLGMMLDETELDSIPVKAMEEVQPINATLPKAETPLENQPQGEPPQERPELTRVLNLLAKRGQSREGLDAWLTRNGYPTSDQMSTEQLSGLASYLESKMDKDANINVA